MLLYMQPQTTSRFSIQRILALCVGPLAVMAFWPLLGYLVLHSSFEHPSDVFFFFGGITLFPLMVLALFGSVPEQVLITIFMLVWLAAAVVPVLWYRRSLTSWKAIGILLSAQSGFSLAQSVMGALLMLGRSI